MNGNGKAAAVAAPPSGLALWMPFAYPVVVGLLEAIVQVAQKGGSSMVALTVDGDSQMQYPTFWCVIAAWLGFSLVVVWWLRKGLANLHANRMLPIEYGTFTAASVLAGLVVYDEVRFVSPQHQVLMGFGVLLVTFGCALVGSRRAVRCRLRCTSDEEEVILGSMPRSESSLLREHLGEHLLSAQSQSML